MACESAGGSKALAEVVSGMACNHRKNTVEDAVFGVNGISRASVDLEKSLLTVVCDPEQVDSTKAQDLVARAGYGARQS
jgi:copper chaperone